MPDPLRDARIRAQRFWYYDGLTEIVVCIVLLMTSVWLVISAPGNSGSWWYVPASLVYLLLLIAFAIFAPRAMTTLREHITYPRSGYVSYGEPRRTRAIVIAAVLTLLSIVAGLLIFRYAGRSSAEGPASWIQWLPAVSGLAMGVLLVYVGLRHGLPRFIAVGTVAIILGFAVSFEYPLRLATVIYTAGVGAAMLCSGGVTFWKYLRLKPSSESKI